MTDNKIDIQPKEVAVINTITKIRIQIQNIIINESAELLVSFYNEKDNYISMVNVKLEGDDYLAWGNDDSYVSNYVCNKFNFIPLPPNSQPDEMPPELQ